MLCWIRVWVLSCGFHYIISVAFIRLSVGILALSWNLGLIGSPLMKCEFSSMSVLQLGDIVPFAAIHCQLIFCWLTLDNQTCCVQCSNLWFLITIVGLHKSRNVYFLLKVLQPNTISHSPTPLGQFLCVLFIVIFIVAVGVTIKNRHLPLVPEAWFLAVAPMMACQW